MEKLTINIELNDVTLVGNLNKPTESNGMIIFSHGSGSSRQSPRNQFVADVLNQHHFTTLLADLLTEEENTVYENRFNIDLLTDRLIRITEKMMEQVAFDVLPVGYFGGSTGAAPAIDAAAFLGDNIKAVVSRGGRTDLAKNISKVSCPVLLLVGSLDLPVIDLNQQSYDLLTSERKIETIQGASHLFEEPGTLDEVALLSAKWFELYVWKQPHTQNIH